MPPGGAGPHGRLYRRRLPGHGRPPRAAYTVSEMVSAKALTFGDKKSAQLIRCKPNGAPYGVQLFGAEPETMGQAARLIQHYDYDFIDINMGCPAPKITSSARAAVCC